MMLMLIREWLLCSTRLTVINGATVRGGLRGIVSERNVQRSDKECIERVC